MQVKNLLQTGLNITLLFVWASPSLPGVSLVVKHQEKTTPWAWAVNGFFPVISTALAAIVAVEMGFSLGSGRVCGDGGGVICVKNHGYLENLNPLSIT